MWRRDRLRACKSAGGKVPRKQLASKAARKHAARLIMKSRYFAPKNPICKNITQRFLDEESADVIFDVGGGGPEGESVAENANNSSAKASFHAHRLVLLDGAPKLAQLCKRADDADDGGVISVSIGDVKPDIFRHLLYHLYGGDVSWKDVEADDAKHIIDAAEKYGVAVGLKLAAEARYVESACLTLDNVLNHMRYANAKDLALLKEVTIDFIVAYKESVMAKLSFDDIPNFEKHILSAMARNEKMSTGASMTCWEMGVNALRRELDERYLDVDGSREAMVARLEGHSENEIVSWQPGGDEQVPPPPFIPENPIQANILSRFLDEKTADVIFEVGGGSQEGGSASKKAKTSIMSAFHAHRLVLLGGAPALLADMDCCKRGDKGGVTSVRIKDVNPGVFRHLLYYAYGGDIPWDEIEAEEVKQVIDAANKFGATALKLTAEVHYVDSYLLTIDNVIDNYLYADAMHLALLKEETVDFMVEYKKDLVEANQCLPGSIVNDLLSAVARKSNTGVHYDKKSDMRVYSLRKKLHKRGLDVDGSRKAMLNRLEEYARENDGDETSSDDESVRSSDDESVGSTDLILYNYN